MMYPAQTSRKIYPAHIYEPIRIKIAQNYLSHELHKLFPSIKDPATWDLITADIESWFDQSPNLCPIRDFWNGVHGISRGFKLKNIVARVTSENLSWSYEHIPIKDLIFRGSFKEHEHLGQFPKASEVEAFYQASKAGKAQKQKDRETMEEMAKTMIMRNEDPIIVAGKDSSFQIIDGNRRTWEALLAGQKTIYAAVGRIVKEPAIYNTWIPTFLLLDLISFIRELNQATDSILHISATIALLIQDSEAGQYEFFNRATSDQDQELRAMVSDKLKSL